MKQTKGRNKMNKTYAIQDREAVIFKNEGAKYGNN